MTDEGKIKTETPAKDGIKDPEAGGDDAPDAVEQLEAANETNVKLAEKLKAQENLSSAERRKQDDRIKDLEIELEKSAKPPEDGERIAALEVNLARSQAVSRFGLSEDDAALLKGTPTEILRDAEYWAGRLKEKTPTDTDEKGEDQTNQQMIDAKVDAAGGNGKPKSPTPKPKKGQLSWLERYSAATPAEREKMNQDVYSGRVDPRPSKQ